MNGKKVRLVYFFAILTFSLFAQEEPTPASSAADIKRNYEWRIQQSKISGQYIPKDIFDAFNELNRLTDAESRQKFMSMAENDAARKLYFSLGRWITTNWGLYEGSRLGHYLREAGVSFPEDQAMAIIVCWHRSLNKKDINFKQVKEILAARRKKEREERLKKMPVIKEEVIKNPATVKKN
ncbi:MAG: hypothetical protein JNL70_10225 [Saprospiraceae bacterium]|nr:hypothetical protein [Saprospiraceae bacterium]